MNTAHIFTYGNNTILLGWLLLTVLPNWKYTQALVLNGLIVLFAIVYSYLVLKDIGSFNILIRA